MLQESESPVRRASQRRYPAWTRYARAYLGNRADADDVVRSAVTRALAYADDTPSENAAHERVLAAIRTEALTLLNASRAAGQRPDADGTADDGTADESVLSLLFGDASTTDPRQAGELAAEMLRELPRRQRRALQMLLTRRPTVPIDDVARRQKVELDALSEDLEDGLDQLAAALHVRSTTRYRGGHPGLRNLAVYVDGALSGDEARRIVDHCRGCSACGDRLGTMVLLRSHAAKAVLPPRLPRGARAGALALTLVAGLVGGVLLARALAPNPWAEHATAETVPEWFHDFLYGYRGGISERDAAVAGGLEKLVEGELADAIARLEPLIEQPGVGPEASAYLGIAHYLNGDSSRRTVELLEAGTSSSRAGRIADWYLANALLARGDIDRARRRLLGLAFVGDWVGRQAQTLLERLAPSAATVVG